MYGFVYLLGFLTAVFAGVRRFPCYENTFLYTLYISVYAALGAVIGGRLGYVLFYEPGYYLGALSEIPLLYRGGMSFHGGALGLLLAVYLADPRGFTVNGDRLAVLSCFILPLGRIANFLNGELWGTPTDLPWGVIFEAAGDGIPRHPVQLYEAVLEGPVLLMLLLLSRRLLKLSGEAGGAMALFGIWYGILRFLAEFFREPDRVAGYLFSGITRGQALCAALALLGLLFLAVLLWRRRRGSAPRSP